MTLGPLPHPAPASTGSGRLAARLVRWAVGLSAGFGTLFAAAVVAAATGGFGGVVAAVAFMGSLAAFVLAVIAKVQHEHSVWLWLPLGVFPGMILFVVLGEAFWWE